jgi:hypothetical protein
MPEIASANSNTNRDGTKRRHPVTILSAKGLKLERRRPSANQHAVTLTKRSCSDQASLLHTMVEPDSGSRKVAEIMPEDVDRLLAKVCSVPDLINYSFRTCGGWRLVGDFAGLRSVV